MDDVESYFFENNILKIYDPIRGIAMRIIYSK